MSQRMKGMVVGLVTSLEDPDGLGRIKVSYPWLSDDNESNWARLATPLAGPELGMWFLPEIGDEAVLAFEMDDIRRPFIVGFLWNGDNAPPSAEAKERIIKTVSGHQITFNDASGKESITIEDSSGVNKVILNKDGISIESTGEFKVKAKKVQVEAETTMDLKASAKLTAKGNPVHLNP